MTADTQATQHRHTQDPIWLQSIVNYLRANAHEFSRHERMQFVFDRSGDTVRADYSVKSIQLKQP